jgi:hypothetical protein
MILAMLICALALALPVAAETATPTPTSADALEITSPVADSEIGGVVSILGTVRVEGMIGYTLEFGAGENPSQWIPILDLRSIIVNGGRLAFWDTTRVPDGSIRCACER